MAMPKWHQITHNHLGKSGTMRPTVCLSEALSVQLGNWEGDQSAITRVAITVDSGCSNLEFGGGTGKPVCVHVPGMPAAVAASQ